MGVFTIKREQFIGVDSGGVNYDGTAQEQEDGSIVLDVKLNVPSELEKLGYSRFLVQILAESRLSKA